MLAHAQAQAAGARTLAHHEGSLLRPRQDGHRQGVDPRLRRALPPRRPHQPPPGAAGRGRAAHLPPVRRGREAARAHPRVDARPHQGVGPRPGAPDRPRDAARDDRADHLRRGARADGGPPHRRRPRLPRVGLPRGDRPAAGRAARRRRRHQLGGRDRRRGPLHRADGLLRLRPGQGRGHGGAGRPHRHRPRRVDRLLGLGHRPAHARGGRAPGRRQPRPVTGQGGPRAGVGGAPVHQAGAAARPHERPHAGGHHEPGPRRGGGACCGGAGRRGRAQRPDGRAVPAGPRRRSPV